VKVLIVDYEDKLAFLWGSVEQLLRRKGFEILDVSWTNLERYGFGHGPDVERVVDIAKGVDVVILHFGDIPAGDANKIIPQIKAVGAKVVVNTVSRFNFPEADEIIPTMGLVRNIANLLDSLQE